MAKKRKARRAHARKHTAVANPSRRRRRAHRNPAPSARRRRRAHRNPAESFKDIAIMVGTGTATAILGPKLVSKLPGSLMVHNIGMIAAGLALAFVGRKKSVLVGAGAGLIVAGATRAITNAVPALAGDYEFNGEEQQAILSHLQGDEFNGPMDGDEFNGPMDGDEFNGPMDGDEFNGPMDGDSFDMAGDFNSPSM